MWIHVRSMLDHRKLRVDGLSKLTKVEDLREKLVDFFNAPVDKQMLIFRGKQLINGHTLYDYDININDIVQVAVRSAPAPPKPEEKEEKEEEKKEEVTEEETQNPSTSSQESGIDEDVELLEQATYKLGDVIDARDVEGCWWEAELVKVTKNRDSPVWSDTDSNANIKKDDNNADIKKDDTSEAMDTTSAEEGKSGSEEKTPETSSSPTLPEEGLKDDGFLYHVKYEGFEDDPAIPLACRHVRPRARHQVKLDILKPGMHVMVNHNTDDDQQRGYWYDAIVQSVRCTRTIKDLVCTIFIGKDLTPMEDCKIGVWWEIFAVEKAGTQLNKITDPDACGKSPTKRVNKPDCEHCKDNPKKKCKHCACRKCAGKDQSDKQIMCDECDGAYHLWCLDPPLETLPEEDKWFCPECKNDATEIVQGGEGLKLSKKKSKMASANSTSKRDWGKGMACVGRQKMCTIVPANHFGPIPGIEVGTLWKFRVQASEAGVHRPHVAGIHGREEDGAYSIVLSGGYEDDLDNGDSFTYTGSGGRDLSGNKRTAEQSCDQVLTRYNRSLAKNCNCKIDAKNGGEAKDWRGGKPVRVVRNCKGRKHSKYAPEEGNRYDGIYKVVKYWPEKGKSGFNVWRYQFRRDDPVPAPWSKEGKKRSEELGLEIQYPEGYLENQAEKEKEKAKKEEKENDSDEAPKKTPKGKRGRKRKVLESSDEENNEEEDKPSSSPVAKKKKFDYKLSEEVSAAIEADEDNKKTWDEVLEHRCEGHQKFLAQVEEAFCCICCQDIVFKPVTTTCNHNVCKGCLQRSFKAEVYCCPGCRDDLGEDFKMPENKSLRAALLKLFPGYENGR